MVFGPAKKEIRQLQDLNPKFVLERKNLFGMRSTYCAGEPNRYRESAWTGSYHSSLSP